MAGEISDTDDDGSIVGTSGSDTIYGGTDSASADSGNAIHDTIDGGQSDDTVYAGDGNDLIFGGDAGDAAGSDIAAKAVDSFQFDINKAGSVQDGGSAGHIGDSITYTDVAVAQDGTPISVRISIVNQSDPDLKIILGYNSDYPIIVNSGNNRHMQGETVDVRIDFLDSNGDPITIDSNFTFRDIDDLGGWGNEGVTFDTTDITSYAVSGSPATNVSADNRGDVIEFTTNTSGNIPDENLWTQVFFEGQSSLNFTLESRAHNAGYGFDTANFANPPIITEVDASGSDLLYGGTGNDSALGGGGNDTIFGEQGNDTLDGGKGDDTLFGGEGNDTLSGGAGTNTLYGGSGQDVVDYSSAEGGVNVDLSEGTATGEGLSDGLSGVDGIIGSDFDDSLTGFNNFAAGAGGYTNVIDGGAGNDVISGLAGNDTLSGGAGNDILYGGKDDDVLSGGSGADVLYGGKGSDTLSGGADADTLFAGDGDDTWAIVDGVQGDSFDGGKGTDRLDASQSSTAVDVTYTDSGTGTVDNGGGDASFGAIEELVLSRHNDTVDASANADGISVDGGGGADSIIGGAGDDTIYGGAGDDTIDAGTGVNTVYGGEGVDTFVLPSTDYSDLGSQIDIKNALLDLNLAGIENWQAAKGHDAAADAGGSGNASSVKVNDLGDDVENSLQWLIGNKAAKDAEKAVEQALNDYLKENKDAEISPRDLSDLAYEVLEPEYGAIPAGLAGLKVYDSAKDMLGTTDSGEEQSEALRDDFLARASHTTIEDFDLGTDKIDLSQVSYLVDEGLSTNDVKITDSAGDGTGNAVLHLPDGSTITLGNVSVYDVDPEALESMGFASADDATGFQNSYLAEAGIIGGGGGDDAITGSDSDETISGGTGNDTMILGGGSDTVSGGDDRDVVVVGDGFDGSTIDGGSGGDDTDRLDLSNVSSGVTVTATGAEEGTFQDSTGATGTFSEIEDLDGSELGDVIIMGSGSNEIAAGGGNDSIDAGAGHDVLNAGDGDDTLAGGAGDDTMTGGAGADLFALDAAGGTDTITDFEVGSDSLETSELEDTSGDMVTADEVFVSGGGGEPQALAFPNGETVLVPDGSVDTSSRQSQFSSLVLMGVPPCFAPGTSIRTPDGERPVETLCVGDLILTVDNGPRPIRWIGVQKQIFKDQDDPFRPILFRAGSLGGGVPVRDLVVSPQHRMLLKHQGAAGASDDGMLAPAKAWVDQPGVRIMRGKRKVSYYALLLDRHEVILAEGTETESFRPGPVIMEQFTAEQRDEIYQIYPDLRMAPEDGLGLPARPLIGRSKAARILDEPRTRKRMERRKNIAFRTADETALGVSL